MTNTLAVTIEVLRDLTSHLTHLVERPLHRAE